MLFLHFLYSKTFKCIFVDLCSKVLTLCTLRLSSFFAFKYLRIYFQTPCWTRLMLHVRKYRMRTQLERWMHHLNIGIVLKIRTITWKIVLTYTEKFISLLNISNIFRKVMHILVNDMACPKRCNGKLFLAYIWALKLV